MDRRSRALATRTLGAILVWGLAAAAWGNWNPAGLTDAELERVLRKGKVTRREDIDSGVTRPMRIWLELDGVRVSACYKDIDYEKRGVTRLSDGAAELNFTDSYRYERAAYLLDRRLGLGMVPVTVIRRLYRDSGAVILWIGDSLSEAERIAQGLRPPELSRLVDQQTDMRIFDALIYNTDRHPDNQLYTPEDWRLHLIDHSRAFRTREELPESFTDQPLTMSRNLLMSLEALSERSLSRLLKRELTPKQIKSLLKRRDLILDRFEKDRSVHGDAVALREEEKLP